MTNRIAGQLALLALASSLCSFADVAWNAVRAGNPVIPGYYADPSVCKFGDTYYIYVTPDGWDVGRGPAGAWSSKDFVNWTFHPMNWPTTDFKWAPSVVQHNGKYYMYNSTPCMIWAAVADTPLGPWTSLSEPGKPLIPDATPKGSIVLDAECFFDTDGQMYLWYSTWWTPTMVRLKSDMKTFDGLPIQYFRNPQNPNPPKGLVQACMEAPYMLKRNGVYYLMYSDLFCQDSSYNVKYSTSTAPDGPFVYNPTNNPVIETSEDGTVDGPGHHTILEDGGKIYIVYHRHDNPHSVGGAYRQTCIDEMRFKPDGTIEKVAPSHMGVGYLAPSTKRDTNLALGKPAKASSFLNNDFRPEYATDGNNGTVWKSATFQYPQWLMVDLGKVCAFKRVETVFQYVQVSNSYVIETSADGTTWTMYADRKANGEVGIMIDKRDASARYVRITLLGNSSGRGDQGPALFGFAVYDGIDKPNQAPVVDAGRNRSLSFRYPEFVLDAGVFDDGLPNGPFKVQWSKASGPGSATIAHADRCRTVVTIDQPGTYVFRLVADDGALKGEGSVTIEMKQPTDSILHYSFDEEGGAIVNDGTENNRYGVLQKGAKRSIGVHGGAVSFHGGESAIAVKPLGTLSNLTLATWINVHTMRGQAGILSSTGGNNGDVRVVVNDDGSIGLCVGGQPMVCSAYRFSTNELGAWQHVAVVFDQAATSAMFYVNGKLDGMRPVSTGGTIDISGQVRIGNGGPFDGELDDLYVFDRAATQAEIAAFAKKPAFATIADVEKLADGATVTLMTKVVTYAPADPFELQRATEYFYIAEPAGSAGIRVMDGKTQKPVAAEDACVSLIGTVSTLPSRERCIMLEAPPCDGAPKQARAAKTTVSVAAQSPKAMASLVTIKGTVKQVAQDGSGLTVSDGSGEELHVVAAPNKPVTRIASGNTIEVTGVITVTAAPPALARVLLLKDIRRISPPPPAALALYDFEEVKDNKVKDNSTSGNEGTLMNGADIVQGSSGKAVRFDGEKSYLQLPNMGVQPVVTIALWMNLTGPGNDPYGSSILHGEGWTWGNLHWFVVNGSSNMAICVNGGGDMHSKTQVIPYVMNKWVHVAVVYDSVRHTKQFYLNGKLDTSADTHLSKPMDLRNSKIGTWNGNARQFKGMMDDIRIYDKALTAEEIAALARK